VNSTNYKRQNEPEDRYRRLKTLKLSRSSQTKKKAAGLIANRKS